MQVAEAGVTDQGGPGALLIAWPKVCPGSCARSFWKVWFSVCNSALSYTSHGRVGSESSVFLHSRK